MWILIFLSISIPLDSYYRASGAKIKDKYLYLSGGFRGGYVIYKVKIPEGAIKFRMGLKMKNISGSSIGIYIKNFGSMRSINLPPRITKIDSSFFLWEATDLEEWLSSRPEFLYLKQGSSFNFAQNGSLEVLLYAGGGFFKRGRFLIREIEIDFEKIPDTLFKLVEEDSLLTIDGDRIYVSVYFKYPNAKNDAQKRALALRGAKILGERKIQQLYENSGLSPPKNFEVNSIEYFDTGVKVKVSALLNL